MEDRYYDEYYNQFYNPDDDDTKPGDNLNWKKIQRGFKRVEDASGNYNDLDNKPQINSVTLTGNKSLSELGIASENSFNDLSIEDKLLSDYIPGTSQTVVFDSNDNPVSITHTANNTTVRTDLFVWGTGTVTETRTLAIGKYITITVNLETLAQTISEIQEVA